LPNPLISPCECRGSIQFIHLECLSLWLFGNQDQQDILHLETRKSQCEICRTNITETEAYQRIVGSMLGGSHRIATPFAVFEGELKCGEE
jgi:E3 ubiquitin-protein ligase DOA10